MNLLRRLIPATLAARLFWGVAAASLISAVVIWTWLYSRFYNSLDREASVRMRQVAAALLSEASGIDETVLGRVARERLLEQVWHLERSSGLMQNLYWLDVSGDHPVFIASFSQYAGSRAEEPGSVSDLLPPDEEDAEDMVYDNINALDRGELVFPDPYAYGAGRRLKIILCPLLDTSGMLESVIGIEADMQYLRLAEEFRNILGEGIALAVLISLLVSVLLSGNVAAKISMFGRNVNLMASGRQPEAMHLSIRELDDLYQSFVRMAADLEMQRAAIRQVFVRKLEELSFTGGAIAHEIRNPLSAIEMHFGLLKRQLSLKSESGAAGPIEEIEQQLQHLRRLLTSFLHYSRQVCPKTEKVDVAAFIARVVELRRQVLGDFLCHVEVENGLTACFDPLMLQQVIENLVNNSFRAAEGRALTIKITAALCNRCLRIELADNGPGIPHELRLKLFTPFVTGNADGSGFGLAISRKLIEAHGGEINYKESPVGAVFVIEVPQNENSGS